MGNQGARAPKKTHLRLASRRLICAYLSQRRTQKMGLISPCYVHSRPILENSIETRNSHISHTYVLEGNIMSNYVRNGRGSAHTGGEWSQWQRHTDHCVARGYKTKRTGADCPESGCRGSRETREVRYFALLVSLAITGESIRLRDGRRVKVRNFHTLTHDELVWAEFLCPISGEWTRIEDAHADRVIPGKLLGMYKPGNIALISATANLAKSDTAPSADYAERVATATAKVVHTFGIPRNNGMLEEWHNVVRASSKKQRQRLGLEAV